MSKNKLCLNICNLWHYTTQTQNTCIMTCKLHVLDCFTFWKPIQVRQLLLTWHQSYTLKWHTVFINRYRIALTKLDNFCWLVNNSQYYKSYTLKQHIYYVKLWTQYWTVLTRMPIQVRQLLLTWYKKKKQLKQPLLTTVDISRDITLKWIYTMAAKYLWSSG